MRKQKIKDFFNDSKNKPLIDFVFNIKTLCPDEVNKISELCKNFSGESLLSTIYSRQSKSILAFNDHFAMRLLSINTSFFGRVEKERLIENRHKSTELQEGYDKRFGLVLRK